MASYTEIFYRMVNEETGHGKRPYHFRVIADVRKPNLAESWFGTISALDPVPDLGLWYRIIEYFGSFGTPPPGQITAIGEFESKKEGIDEVKDTMKHFGFRPLS